MFPFFGDNKTVLNPTYFVSKPMTNQANLLKSAESSLQGTLSFDLQEHPSSSVF